MEYKSGRQKGRKKYPISQLELALNSNILFVSLTPVMSHTSNNVCMCSRTRRSLIISRSRVAVIAIRTRSRCCGCAAHSWRGRVVRTTAAAVPCGWGRCVVGTLGRAARCRGVECAGCWGAVGPGAGSGSRRPRGWCAAVCAGRRGGVGCPWRGCIEAPGIFGAVAGGSAH